MAATFERVVAGRIDALDLHRPVPARGGGDGSAIGSEADQYRGLAEPLADYLAGVVFAPDLAHFGVARIVDVRVVRPDDGPGLRSAMIEDPLERVEHVLVAKVPGVGVVIIDRAVVGFRAGDYAGILLGREQRVAIFDEVGESLIEEVDQRPGYLFLAGSESRCQCHAAVARRLVAPRRDAAIAFARNPGGVRVHTVEVIELSIDPRTERVDVETVDACTGARIGKLVVDRGETLQEPINFRITPHRRREAAK